MPSGALTPRTADSCRLSQRKYPFTACPAGKRAVTTRVHRIISRVSPCWEKPRTHTVFLTRASPGGWDMTEILVQVGVEEQVPPATRVVEHPAWPVLKDAVEQIRPWQSKDGSIDFAADGPPDPAAAALPRRRAVDAVAELSRLLPHDAAYHEALVTDLRRWAGGGFRVP